MNMRFEAERLAMLLGRGYPTDVILQDRDLTPREKRQVRRDAEDLRMSQV